MDFQPNYGSYRKKFRLVFKKDAVSLAADRGDSFACAKMARGAGEENRRIRYKKPKGKNQILKPQTKN